jgi:hypothetical protein
MKVTAYEWLHTPKYLWADKTIKCNDTAINFVQLQLEFTEATCAKTSPEATALSLTRSRPLKMANCTLTDTRSQSVEVTNCTLTGTRSQSVAMAKCTRHSRSYHSINHKMSDELPLDVRSDDEQHVNCQHQTKKLCGRPDPKTRRQRHLYKPTHLHALYKTVSPVNINFPTRFQ